MEPLTGLDNANLENKIIKTPKLSYTPEPGGMGKTFFQKMSTYGNATAQINGLTGEKDTYASLLQRCIRTAITMSSKGITSEDIITICSFNHINSCVPFIAALFLGAKIANLDPTISLTDTVYLLKQVCPKMVFVGPEAAELIENALQEANINAQIITFGNSTKHTEFSEFLETSDEERHFKPFEVNNLKDTAVIYFSSGTTGMPKGICLNHFGFLSQSFQITEMGFDISIALGYASLYWISSALFMIAGILSKGCRVLIPRYDPDLIWELLEKFKVTTSFLAPSQAVAMYKKGRPEGIDLTHFETLLLGGGPISKEQMEEITDILPGTNVVMVYGQTELSGCGTCFYPNRPKDMMLVYERPGSSGRPLKGLTYKVVDIETEKILGPNQKGELRIKTDFQMNGYYKQDSSEAWDSDGFLKTGDVVYYDEDLCFYIVDRVKEMLKFQSWHVPPAKLEGVLLLHPAIQAAVVIGIPHPEDGDHPAAVVVLNKSAVGSVTAEDIVRFVEGQVDDRQRLRGGVKFIDSIPITPSGKPKRREVRNMVIRGDL